MIDDNQAQIEALTESLLSLLFQFYAANRLLGMEHAKIEQITASHWEVLSRHPEIATAACEKLELPVSIDYHLNN